MLRPLAHQVLKAVLLPHGLDPRLPGGDAVAQLELPLLVVLDLETPLQLGDVGGILLRIDAKVLAETASNARLFRGLRLVFLGFGDFSSLGGEPSAVSGQLLHGLGHCGHGGCLLLRRGRPVSRGWRVSRTLAVRFLRRRRYLAGLRELRLDRQLQLRGLADIPVERELLLE